MEKSITDTGSSLNPVGLLVFYWNLPKCGHLVGGRTQTGGSANLVGQGYFTVLYIREFIE